MFQQTNKKEIRALEYPTNHNKSMNPGVTNFRQYYRIRSYVLSEKTIQLDMSCCQRVEFQTSHTPESMCQYPEDRGVY